MTDREQIRRDLERLRSGYLLSRSERSEIADRLEAELEQTERKQREGLKREGKLHARLERAERNESAWRDSAVRSSEEIVRLEGVVEQAERERDEWRALAYKRNAQLAAVPALVEALRYCARPGAADSGTARRALAAWESE